MQTNFDSSTAATQWREGLKRATARDEKRLGNYSAIRIVGKIPSDCVYETEGNISANHFAIKFIDKSITRKQKVFTSTL